MSGVQQMLYGGAGDSVSLFNTTAASFTAGSTAIAQYELTLGGDVRQTSGSNSVTDTGDWIAPKINMSAYSVRCTVNSGALTSGTTGSYVNLGTTRTWTLQGLVGSGSQNASCTFEIRRDSDSVVVASATIAFQAEAV